MRSRPSRRRFLQTSALAGAAALGTAGLAGCGSPASISSDPHELVMWYWYRSASPELLDKAADAIPGTQDTLRADVIGTDFDTKLRTSLAGGAYIPDITYINSNNALYFRNENKFIDMNDLGAKDVEDDYYPWKWKLGLTPEDRFCFFPLDIGPTGFYYRADVFDEAGLPTSPDELATATSTWEDWIEVGKELRGKKDSAMVVTAQTVFEAVLNASTSRYFDDDDKPLFEQDGNAVREAWDTAVATVEAKVSGNRQTDNDKNASWSSGATAGNVSAAWWAQILEETAPDTGGNWRITDQPVQAGNNGGSFAAIPHTCKDPEAAFAFISWIANPANQSAAYNDVQLFPSTPDSYESGDMKYKGKFFGDQDPLAFFSHAAETVPTSFISTWESVVSGNFTLEINNVEASGKDPDRAWSDAIEASKKVLRKRGVVQ
jgi:cellobiose transport system substrate-binding protein